MGSIQNPSHLKQVLFSTTYDSITNSYQSLFIDNLDTSVLYLYPHSHCHTSRLDCCKHLISDLLTSILTSFMHFPTHLKRPVQSFRHKSEFFTPSWIPSPLSLVILSSPTQPSGLPSLSHPIFLQCLPLLTEPQSRVPLGFLSQYHTTSNQNTHDRTLLSSPRS